MLLEGNQLYSVKERNSESPGLMVYSSEGERSSELRGFTNATLQRML